MDIEISVIFEDLSRANPKQNPLIDFNKPEITDVGALVKINLCSYRVNKYITKQREGCYNALLPGVFNLEPETFRSDALLSELSSHVLLIRSLNYVLFLHHFILGIRCFSWFHMILTILRSTITHVLLLFRLSCLVDLYSEISIVPGQHLLTRNIVHISCHNYSICCPMCDAHNIAIL